MSSPAAPPIDFKPIDKPIEQKFLTGGLRDYEVYRFNNTVISSGDAKDKPFRYLQILRRQFGTKRVAANKVYQEYIADRHHLHMNATKWHSLSDFVKYLGRNGHCVADETDKGWFITYIDRDPETLAMQEKMAKKQKMDKDDAERLAEFIEEQVRRGKTEEEPCSSGYSELKRENEEDTIKIELKLGSKQQQSTPSAIISKRPFDTLDDGKKEKKIKAATSDGETKKLSALDELIQEEEQKKEKNNRKDYWLAEGIVPPSF
uniref:Kin17_mid domain-containing protein n=1 Tax=Anopheles melas TaxID=34690 RepID=A0A182UAA4_9DIPT